MDQQTFELLMSRLDLSDKQNQERYSRIEAQNAGQLELLQKHLDKDSAVYKTVDRHTTYFKAMGLGLPALIGYVATKLGLK